MSAGVSTFHASYLGRIAYSPCIAPAVRSLADGSTMHFIRGSLLGTVFIISQACGGLVSTAYAADAILILDASGSMWGVVDGQTKIAAARKAVESILSKWKPSDRLGLMAYGHRAKGECRDIEMVVPVASFDANRIRDAVNALNPKGKTPIAESLRAAATALRANENKATVILVSDGIETCAPDPCAVAAELKKAGVGFTAHVVGFDVADPAAKNQLQCIARATGGVYLDARNASGLESALGRAVEATQGARVQSEAAVQAPPDPFRGKTLRGIARLAAALDPVSDLSVGWLLHKRTPSGEMGEYVTRFDGSPFIAVADPGDYVVLVEYGLVKKEVPVKVERGKLAQLDVALDAGYVTSEGSVPGAGKADNITWEVHGSKDEWIATDYAAVPRFILPAGAYALTLLKGVAKTRREFALAAGDSVNVALTLDVGRLSVSAVYAANGPKVENGLTVEVRQPSNTEGEPGEWVATHYDALSNFDLPAGAYELHIALGAAKRVVNTDIRSGALTRLNANLDAGVAAIKAEGVTQIEIVRAERDINNERRSVHVSYDPQINIALNAGQYVAVVEYGDVKGVETPFIVTAGHRIEVEAKR